MATRAIFTPFSAEFPAANMPELNIVQRRPYLAFDDGTDETCHWTGIAPQGLTGTLTAIISYIMASATANEVRLGVQVEAITDGDATDLDATTSFDTINTAEPTVPATAGYIDQVSITLTNADSLIAGDYYRLLLTRDADHANDDATGDCRVLSVELRDGA